MIERFSDHAANERTFLSWVRTAIAIVGFGLLVAKINPGTQDSKVLSASALLIFGTVLIIAATLRFLMIRKLIRDNNHQSNTPVLLDIALAIMFCMMMATILVFGIHISGGF